MKGENATGVGKQSTCKEGKKKKKERIKKGKRNAKEKK